MDLYNIISSIMMMTLLIIMFLLSRIHSKKIISTFNGCKLCSKEEGYLEWLLENKDNNNKIFICKSCKREKIIKSIITNKYKKSYLNFIERCYINSSKILHVSNMSIAILGIFRIVLVYNISSIEIPLNIIICNIQILLILISIYTILNSFSFIKRNKHLNT